LTNSVILVREWLEGNALSLYLDDIWFVTYRSKTLLLPTDAHYVK